MKKLFIFVLIVAFFLPGIIFAAEFAAILQVQKGAEADIQEYKLYSGTSEADVTNQVNPAILVASGTPDTIPDVIRYTYQVTVPDASEGDYFFGMTAVDTSNNESGMSNIVSKRWDFLAPTPLILSIE